MNTLGSSPLDSSIAKLGPFTEPTQFTVELLISGLALCVSVPEYGGGVLLYWLADPPL